MTIEKNLHMQIEIFKKCKGPESLPLSNENNPEGTLKLIPGEIIKSIHKIGSIISSVKSLEDGFRNVKERNGIRLERLRHF